MPNVYSIEMVVTVDFEVMSSNALTDKYIYVCPTKGINRGSWKTSLRITEQISQIRIIILLTPSLRWRGPSYKDRDYREESENQI
jgi:hypothetical protein